MNCIPLVLSFNHPELTAKAVDSILNNPEFQSFGSQVPLVLVHNGSEPKHRDFLIKAYPAVDHLVLEVNKGYSGGANAGIDYVLKKYASLSPWTLFLTNDCELITWPKLDFDQPSAILAPWIWSRKSDRIDSIGGKIDLIKGVPSHLKSSEEFQNLILRPTKNQLPYIPGSAFLIHQEVFTQLGGFNEKFHTYWEDIELSLRAFLGGMKLGDLDSFQVRHKIGKTCHKHSHYTTYLYQRNRHWVSRHYVKGWWPRLVLEFNLWLSWLKLCFKLFKTHRYEDMQKLIKGIKEPNSINN